MMIRFILAAIRTLPIYYEDVGHPQKDDQQADLAVAVQQASVKRPQPPREWAALLLTVGYHETGFSLRVHAGYCKPLECDRGKARGPWQNHQNVHTSPWWTELQGLEHTAVQARVASDMLERSYWVCARSGVPWVQATLNAYAGRRCDASDWRGLNERLATFAKIRVRLG